MSPNFPAKRDQQELIATTAKAQSALESERNQLAHSLRQLDAERREWQALFLQYHHRGGIRGGREEPPWLVVLKSFGVGLASCIVAVPLGMLFWPVFFLPFAIGIAAFVYFRRTRFTPNYRKFRCQEATHFAVVDVPRPELKAPQPRIIDARLEDHK